MSPSNPDIRDFVGRLKGNPEINRDDLLKVLAEMADEIAALKSRLDRLELRR